MKKNPTKRTITTTTTTTTTTIHDVLVSLLFSYVFVLVPMCN